jgi:SlyX protein
MAMENEHLAERLQKIESSLAHLEHLYEQLNEVVLSQGKQLDKMSSHQQRLSQTVEGIELERIRSLKQKPPHYQ